MADIVRKRSGARSLVLLGLLGLAVFLAVKTGWAGFGWAQLRSRVYPRTDALLAWVPAAAPGVAILDPHQIKPQRLGSPSSSARNWLERVRGDVKRSAGVDLFFDVDKLALTPSLVVMSGRFDGEKISSKLGEYQYVRADYGGHGYLVRAGEDALMVVDDDTLLYGDEAALKAAVDAKAGASLLGNEPVKDRLARIGWDHPLLGTVQLSGDRPSLRAMIAGTTGPRAVTFGVKGGPGVDLRVNVETASATAADDLVKLLNERREGAQETLPAMAGPVLGARLAEVARDTVIQADATTGQVNLSVHVGADALEALARGVDPGSPWAEAVKGSPLFKLVFP